MDTDYNAPARRGMQMMLAQANRDGVRALPADVLRTIARHVMVPRRRAEQRAYVELLGALRPVNYTKVQNAIANGATLSELGKARQTRDVDELARVHSGLNMEEFPSRDTRRAFPEHRTLLGVHLTKCRGAIPPAFPFRAWSTMTFLTLVFKPDCDKFELPSSIGDLTSLFTLGITGGLRGTLPRSIGRLVRLSKLYITKTDLTGPIPEELGRLPLASLTIIHSGLTGPIPASLFSSPRLKILDLEDNLLDGPIPAAVGQATDLKTLDMSSNLLTGSLPAELAQLVNLTYLDLRHNGGLHTQIPGVPPQFNVANLYWTTVL